MLVHTQHLRSYGSRLILAFGLSAICAMGFAGEPPKMKMTTDVPDGIAAPDSVESSIGTLRFKDGVPDEATAQAAYDSLDRSRAVSAYMNTIQIASMHGMRKGMLGFGPENYTVLGFKELMDSKALFLTPNTSSVYYFMWADTKDTGPLVIESPPNVLGIIDDFWFHYVADFGNAGPDKGKGGKFLLLPPDYKGRHPGRLSRGAIRNLRQLGAVARVPEGRRPKSRRRRNREDVPYLSSGQERQRAEDELRRCVRRAVQHDPHDGLPVLVGEINEVIQSEPGGPLGSEMLGLLASIGIEKGKKFTPDDRMKKILTDAAKYRNGRGSAFTGGAPP